MERDDQLKRSEIRNNLACSGLTEEDLKPHIKIEGSRGKWKFVDSRTYEDEEGYYHVYPYGFTRHQVYIACPLCGETHFHGIGTNKDYEGHRAKHCRYELLKIDSEYTIEKLDQETEQFLMDKAIGGKYYAGIY